MKHVYNFIFAIVKKRLSRMEKPSASEYMESRDVADWEPYIRQNLSTLDSNIASLLTHVSAMIAATGILMAVFEEPFTRILLMLEMTGYCMATILLVVNLPYSHPVPHIVRDTSPKVDVYYGIYLSRRYLYVKTAHFVLFLTIGFAITAISHLFLHSKVQML